MNRRVNAVVLNYNQLDGTLQAVAELKRSRGIDVDVLVVDAASAEHERKALRAHVAPDRLLLLPDNRGYAGGMNAGIEFWRDHDPDSPVLLATPDARVSDDVALGLWQCLHDDAAVGAAGPVIVYRDQPRRIGAGGEIDARRQRVALIPEVRSTSPYDVDWLEGCCLLLRPQAIAAAGGLDETYFLYYEEIDLCHRMRRDGWRVRVVPGITVRHPKDGPLPPHYYYYMNRNAYRFWARNFGRSTTSSAVGVVRSTLWLGMLWVGSLLLPGRWREASVRWQDWRRQLAGAWAGTRDHLRGKYGRGAVPTPHQD